MQREKPKTLEEILRNSPEARAYNAELRSRRKPDPLPEFDAPPCEDCGGLGWVTYAVKFDHPKFGQTRPCPNPNCPTLKKQRAEQYAKLCTLAQIPDEYKALTFDGWREMFNAAPQFQAGKLDAYGAALAFVAARDQRFLFTLDEAADAAGLPRTDNDGEAKCSLVLSGEPGVGKTSLGICAMRELIDGYQLSAVYLLMDEFFAALQERFKDKQEHEFAQGADDAAEVIRLYQQAPVLIMDEFPHKPGKSEWWIQSVYQLINYRHNNHMPTIITTNLDALTLMHEWGAPIVSRIQHMAHWFVVGGLEVRGRGAEIISR